MKVNIYKQPGLQENHLDVYYDKMNLETKAVIGFADAINQQIQGKMEDQTRIIYPYEVYYFEVADRRCFAYLDNSVWQVKLTLNDVLRCFGEMNFVRIGKSMVINLNHVQILKPDLNAKVNVVMKNGETVVLSRKYRSEFYSYLERLWKYETNYKEKFPPNCL